MNDELERKYSALVRIRSLASGKSSMAEVWSIAHHAIIPLKEPPKKDIIHRLAEACDGHPDAKIPWPHRLLHDAMDEIMRLREEKK